MIQLMLMFLLVANNPRTTGSEIGAKVAFENPIMNTTRFSSHDRIEVENKKGKPQQKQTTKPAPRPLGVSYWIQQVDDHGRSLGKVRAGKIFHSGNRIQLVVKSNDEGYLAVIQEMANGEVGLLYPGETELGRVSVKAYSEILLPDPRHSFTFDEKPGKLHLLLVLARTLEELVALRLGGDIDKLALENLKQLAVEERGAKNLIVEAFSDPLEDPASYTVNLAGGPVIQEIGLVHEP